MVESQRDLLLKAIQGLREKSTACQQNCTSWDATADINNTLRELGVPVHDSDIMRESIMEELATPYPSREIVNLGTSQDDQLCFESKDASINKSPSLEDSFSNSDLTHMLNTQLHSAPHSAEPIPKYDRMFNTNEPSHNAALLENNVGFDDTSSFDEATLMTDWPASGIANFDFQDFVDFEHLDMNTIQPQQTYQNSSLR